MDLPDNALFLCNFPQRLSSLLWREEHSEWGLAFRVPVWCHLMKWPYVCRTSRQAFEWSSPWNAVASEDASSNGLETIHLLGGWQCRLNCACVHSATWSLLLRLSTTSHNLEDGTCRVLIADHWSHRNSQRVSSSWCVWFFSHNETDQGVPPFPDTVFPRKNSYSATHRCTCPSDWSGVASSLVVLHEQSLWSL